MQVERLRFRVYGILQIKNLEPYTLTLNPCRRAAGTNIGSVGGSGGAPCKGQATQRLQDPFIMNIP